MQNMGSSCVVSRFYAGVYPSVKPSVWVGSKFRIWLPNFFASLGNQLQWQFKVRQIHLYWNFIGAQMYR